MQRGIAMEVELRNENFSATVSSLGGEMLSFRRGDADILWTGDGRYWDSHAPMLFPFVSALNNGKTIIKGREYEMGIHGFIRHAEFKLESKSGDSVVFSFCADEQTKQMYPYDFKAYVIHQLCGNGFETAFKIVNTGNEVLPFCIGGHPGFCVGNLEDWKLEFEKEENGSFYYTVDRHMNDKYISDKKLKKTVYLNYSDFDNDALIAQNLNSGSVNLVKRDGSGGIKFNFSGFNVLAVWTPPGMKAPFVCLEPWNGIPPYEGENDNFENKKYLIKLSEGQSYQVSYSVSII